MDGKIKRILGRTIHSVVVTRSDSGKVTDLVFFVFDDGTAYGFGGNISASGALPAGGEESAIKNAHMFNKENTRVYSLRPSVKEPDNYRKIPDLTELTHSLMDFGLSLSANVLLPTVVPEAVEIVATDPYAFCISACLDRGTKAEIIWTIPFDMKNALGHLDPFKINQMTLDDLETLFYHLPRHPRYLNDAPRTIKELTRIVVKDCGGDASRIWKGKTAIQVHRTFDSIHGVGPGIASMAVLLIEKAFPVRFEDRENMDIKPDVHTVRVLYRLGVSNAMTSEAALETSRKMNPEFPGKVDGALWEIGRHWCHPTGPDCARCPVTSLCEKRLEDVPLSQSDLSSQLDDVNLRQEDEKEDKRKIVLIACVSKKLSTRAKAKDLYISPLFRKNLTYARSLNPDAIYILSAKYGLVELETEIDPYNHTLNTLTAGEIKAWANHVLLQLAQVADLRNDHFIFLAGMKYRKYLLPHLASYEIPLEGLPIGKQLQFLS